SAAMPQSFERPALKWLLEATMENVPVDGRHTVRSAASSPSKSGRVCVVTRSVAGLLLAEPCVLVNTARYWRPLSVRATPQVRFVAVAPGMSYHDTPRS